jgi:hypothetical protein
MKRLSQQVESLCDRLVGGLKDGYSPFQLRELEVLLRRIDFLEDSLKRYLETLDTKPDSDKEEE